MRPMRGVWTVALALVALAAAAGAGPVVQAQNPQAIPPAEARDPRIAVNPLLAELAISAPRELPGFLAELDRITVAKAPENGARRDYARATMAVGATASGAATKKESPAPAKTASGPQPMPPPAPPPPAAPAEPAPSSPPAATTPAKPSPAAAPIARAGHLLPTAQEAELIRRNPDIAYAYEVNPDPMLELLRRMIEAARKAK